VRADEKIRGDLRCRNVLFNPMCAAVIRSMGSANG
jgi:hypothetical protein